MKGASFNDAILSFFSRHGQYFHPTKDQPRTRPPSPFLYICCNFGQIFCTNVIQFFSVENMGHNQLRKCSKYHLVSLLNEKQRSTFANFLHLFYPFPLLTNSALEQGLHIEIPKVDSWRPRCLANMLAARSQAFFRADEDEFVRLTSLIDSLVTN